MTQPQPVADQRAVTAAYQQQTTATRVQLAAFMAALWASLPDYRNGSMREFVSQALPMVSGAMQHMQALTAAYLATLNGLSGGSATPVAARAVDVASVRSGADPQDVYERPFHLVWRMLADQQPLDSAKVGASIRAGEARAVQLALTDVQLAKTHTARDLMARNRNVVGYRRQLEGAHSCALCIVASTQRYHKADLLPVHPACDCSVVPIFGGEKIDLNLDPALLEAIHATVADQFGADSSAARRIPGAFTGDGDPLLYRDVLVTHHHGELGPILGIHGQHWTGPGSLAA
jgi:hypothetical protein